MGRRTPVDSQPDDAFLVARARAGDVAAFEQLYRQNVGRAYALCLRMTADPALAEELTQEVFVRAWQKLKTFRGNSAFATWLHRIAVNVVLGERRTRSRRAARITTTDDVAALDAPASPLTPGVRMDLEEALARLPEGARTVFVLHDVEGYRHHEIASMTGMAAGTSKAQLHRARRLLREALR